MYFAWEDEAIVDIYNHLTATAQADQNSSALGGKGERTASICYSF